MTKINFRPDYLSRQLQKGGRDYTRELVRQRDGRVCQMCGKKWEVGQRRFDIHHIIGCGFKSKNYDRIEDMDNLITYCHKCHINIEAVTNKIRSKTGRFKMSQYRNHHPFYRHKESPQKF